MQSVHANEQHHIESLDIVINTPKGFIAATNFAGLIHPQYFATIRYKETITPFNNAKQQLLQSLNTINNQQAITISGHTGILVQHNKTVEDNPIELWTLIFGDKISTISIEASIPKIMADKLGSQLQQSLKSVRWLRMESEQTFTGLPFVADESELLKIKKRTTNSLVFTDQSLYDPNKAIAPVLVLSSGISEQSLDQIESFSKELLKIKRLENIEIVSQQATKVSKIQAFHISAIGIDKITGKQAKIYQTLVYRQFKYLLIQGMVEAQQAEHIWPQFEHITNSVKFKKP